MTAQELPETPPASLAQTPSRPPGQLPGGLLGSRLGGAGLGPTDLAVASVSRDGRRMLLVDGAGNEYSVALATPPPPVDETGSRGGESRRSEKPMNSGDKAESTLRPREIQSRIRSGESPETVADAAGVPIERIMPFAAPVLAEREHIAERAQRASVRRPAGETATPSGARTLGDAVAARMRSFDLDPESIAWDSWRRNDGRWALLACYGTPDRSGTAHLTFDPPGNYVSLDDDDARWLVGDALPSVDSAPDDLAPVRERRLAAVAPELDLEALEAAEQPMEAYLDSAPAAASRPVGPEPAEDAEEEPPARRAPKRKGRASVPSWDEIMFGGSGD